MKVILLIVISILCGSMPELSLNTNQFARTFNRTKTPSKKIRITFTGTVKSIEPLGRRELQVIPVDFNSRFAVGIHIESVSPTEVPLAGDTDRVFAIHSPAMLFGVAPENIIGRKYRFKITWNEVRSKSKFSDLIVD